MLARGIQYLGVVVYKGHFQQLQSSRLILVRTLLAPEHSRHMIPGIPIVRVFEDNLILTNSIGRPELEISALSFIYHFQRL
jgi:hypothetical protein